MKTAKDRFEELDKNRQQVLQRARQYSALTLPSVMPPQGSDENTVLTTPYQSVGARGVNNLAAKLLLALFPPNLPFFKYTVDDHVLEALQEKRTDAEEKLRQIENRTLRRFEKDMMRDVSHSAIVHLIVTGNALLFMPKGSRPRVYRLDQFVIRRDPSGKWMELIVQEDVDPDNLTKEVKEACKVNDKEKVSGKEKTVQLYTKAYIEKGMVKWSQEINQLMVPDSEGQVKEEDSPFIPLRWKSAPSEDYGRGMVEQYYGDLVSLEGLYKATLAFAAVSSKVVFLNNPNGMTDIDDLVDAESGDIVEGRKDDVEVLQSDKLNDFRVVKEVIDDLSLRLSYAFLIRSGTTRDAERVTAEEIRAVAQELEDALGGSYTVLSTEWQLPLVRRYMKLMKDDGDFPTLPKEAGGVIEPVIITGFDALGRNHELNKLRMYFADLRDTFGDVALGLFRPAEVAKVFGTGHNVDLKDLLKTPEELAQEQQQAMASQLMDKAAGPVAGAMASNLTQTGDA